MKIGSFTPLPAELASPELVIEIARVAAKCSVTRRASGTGSYRAFLSSAISMSGSSGRSTCATPACRH